MSDTLTLTEQERHELEKELGEPIPYHDSRNQVQIISETPRHRLICDLYLSGRYQKNEIATALNFTLPVVYYTLRQPWALDYMAKTQQAAGLTELEKTYAKLTALCEKAADKQARLLDLPLEPEFNEEGVIVRAGYAETVRKATNDVINRVCGTPRASVEITHATRSVDEMTDAEVVAELARVKALRPIN